jgi:hypothetical protein
LRGWSQTKASLASGRGGLDDELACQRQHVGRAGGVVGQAAALADLVQQRRAHAFAQQRRGQHVGQVRLVAQRGRLETQHGVALRTAAHAAQLQAALPDGVGHRVGAASRHGAESGLDAAEEALGIHRPGHGHHHVAGGVLLAHVGQQVFALEALQVGAVADDGLARGVQAVAGAVEELEGHRGRVFLELGELVQDHLALALQLVGREAAVQHDVGQQLDEGRQVLRQAFDVEGCVVLVGVGVDLGAQALGVEVDALAVARGRALEGHVLHHVADAVQPPRLVLAAGADEHAQAHRLAPGQGYGDGAQAAAQFGQQGGAHAVRLRRPRCAARARSSTRPGPRTARSATGPR